MSEYDDNIINVQNDNYSGAVVFDDSTYNKEIKSVPVPPREIGIDTNNSFLSDLAISQSSLIDTSQIEKFTSLSQNRDSVYALIDSMCEDSTIAAVLETYTEDATEQNDFGRIVWAESDKPEVAKYVNFLLDSMNVDKNIFKWVNILCKYGDLYLRLYRESEYDTDPISEQLQDTEGAKDKNKGLSEAIVVNAYSDSDHYVHHLECMSNPAEIFELTKFDKSYAYIIAPAFTQPTNYTYNNQFSFNFANNFRFYSKDIQVYGPTEFVHGCLDDSSSRTPEYVYIFRTEEDKEKNENGYRYKVRRGQSLFYNVFKIWRELNLLQNSVLLNRITKSSIVRTISVEVGDMPKEQVAPVLQDIKRLFEQKMALQQGVAMNEYTNPGPVENTVYLPTRGGNGAVAVGQVGGDVNVGQLTDLEFFRDLLFGALRIPKQYFGFTDDQAGFNGGQSLSIISSRYAKMIKRIQTTICQTLTDAINLMLIDKSLNSYINDFKLKMVPPTTQEEIDRRDNISSKISIVNDVMNTLNDVQDPIIKLKILKVLLSEALTTTKVTELIEEDIKAQELDQEKTTESTRADVSNDDNLFGDSTGDSISIDDLERVNIPQLGNENEGEANISISSSEEERGNLPSPDQLGLDFTNNENNFS